MAMSQTQTVAVELEKVQSAVPTLFDRKATFFSAVEKKKVEKVSNRDMRIPMEIRPGGLFGHFDPAGGDMGRGEGPTFEKATVTTQNFKHAVEYHKKAEWGSDEARKAVVQAIRKQLATAMAEFRRHVDSVMMTSGNGVVATISSVSNAGGFDTYTLDSGFGARLLRFGQKVNVYQPDLSALRHASGSETSITYHDLAAKQIKVATVTGAMAGDKILLSGLSGASPTSMLGVPYHHNSASTGTWLGLDRASYPEIRGNSVDAASASLALSHARLAMNKIGDRLGLDNGMPLQAWMHPCQVAAYEEIGQSVQVINRTGAKSQGLDLYFDVAQLAGAPIKKSWSWAKNRIDFINLDAWGRAEMHPAGFYEEGGRKLFELRGASGGVAAASIFYIVASFNLVMLNPVNGAYIENLAIPSGY